ncbi:MAG: hypothetical protein O7D34_02350 [Ignavibacteria bacterium]|nr:hypothetical protein [Ignavibacteria bacterium]
MPNKPTKSGSELFIVDNSDSDWKVRNYLHDWADIAHTFDIATYLVCEQVLMGQGHRIQGVITVQVQVLDREYPS